MLAMKMMASAIWETGRLGNGFTDRSEPSSTSSCQPGKVARRRRQMNAKMIATILQEMENLAKHYFEGKKHRFQNGAYIRYGNTIMSLN